ncbi:hypothetical protein BDP_0762 [Bifidobacterium dentium Bd1]|uniref:Uncharacterized protein n=1 Tax=Bifidobacterium dentium (strain ATCC 27534 / DSM 20436 / JCM 1195 / Bd1) TaxID=401473 RepID=D2Q9D8_BIFDB|nr:hypothetical protein BDP_0762 [Bifidobacterium dentium Bd1]
MPDALYASDVFMVSLNTYAR